MNETAPAQTLVRKRKLAQLLGASPRTADTWVASGVIPDLFPSSHLHVFDAAQVKLVLTANRSRRWQDDRKTEIRFVAH